MADRKTRAATMDRKTNDRMKETDYGLDTR